MTFVNHSPTLPDYAIDGRTINWNADKTAAAFYSSEAEYHSDRGAFSASMLKLADRSLAHLQATLNNPMVPTRAMLLGSAMHCATLEPALFASRYAVWKGARRGPVYKALMAQLPSGVAVLTQAEREVIDGQVAALQRMPVIVSKERTFSLQDLIEVGHKERNYYWVDPRTGLTCRARMDLTVSKIVIDLKRTQDARPEYFRHDCSKYGYSIQAAFYQRGYAQFLGLPEDEVPVLFAAVEGIAPYGAMIHQADRDYFILDGRRRVDKLLPQLAHAVKSGQWPSYSREPSLLKMAPYQLYRENPSAA